MQSIQAEEELVGSIRRFGSQGITYEVLGIEEHSNNGSVVKIHIFETGEETDYSLEDALNDPQES
ncbi:MAG: DUF5397 family protein [Thermosynechococcaceae cyanobacterium]